MKNKEDKLKEIFETDQFNLLHSEANEKSEHCEEDQRLIDSFKEISEFYEEHNIAPGKNGILEFKLHSRLEHIRKSPSKVKKLLPFDFYNLLQVENTKSIEPIEIIQEDPFGILDDSGEDLSIYEMKTVSKSDRIRPEYLSRRRICKNFADYEGIFEQISEDLKERKRRLISFDPSTVEEGKLYVLNGVVLLLEKLDIDISKREFKSGDRERVDGRTKCIFDNGTESDMLLRSLVKALHLDGFGISEEIIQSSGMDIVEEDEEHGFIYILISKSLDPDISKIQDLYKIGYSRGDISVRIRNAKSEPTYLMAEVELVSAFRCYNMNTYTLEGRIHNFFSKVRLEIEVIDVDGKVHRPREWFCAPIGVIEDAVELIVNNSIEQYYYDERIQVIVKH